MADPVPSSDSAPGLDAVPEHPRTATGAGPDLFAWRDRLDELRARWTAGPVLAWLVGAVVVGGVALWLLRPAPTPVEEVLPLASTTVVAEAGPGWSGGSAPASPPEAPAGAELTDIVAHAAGAVARPGVYRLEPDARVDDLVRTAGGLAPDADPSRLNLAAPLADGSRVYVPRVDEEVPEAVGPDRPPAPGGGAGGGTGPATGSAELIDINTADAALLDELPGVGPATAAAIVSYREESGGFRVVDDLLEVRGIGQAKLDQLRPLVTVG